MRRLILQATLEFLSSYGSAILILAAVVAAIFLVAAPQKGTTYSPSYCYITPELYCYQMLVVSNSIGTGISIAFTNNYGSSIYLPTDPAFYASPSPTGQYYPGSCSDPSTNAPVGVLKPGASAMCVADIPGLVIQPGTQLEPTFYLNYYMCKDPACGISARSAALQSTSGSAVAYAVPVAPTTSTISSTSTSSTSSTSSSTSSTSSSSTSSSSSSISSTISTTSSTTSSTTTSTTSIPTTIVPLSNYCAWFTNPFLGTVDELSGYDTPINTYNAGPGPTYIAASAGGGVWVTNSGGASNTVTNIDAYGNSHTYGVAWAPLGIAIDNLGYIWTFGEQSDTMFPLGLATKLTYYGQVVGNYYINGGWGPQAMAIDASGNLIFAEYYYLSGGHVTKMSNDGANYGNIYWNSNLDPTSIAIDHSGNLWMPNYLSQNVVELSPTGNVNGVYKATGGQYPYGIAIDNNGNVWVYYQNSQMITELSNSGTVMGTYNTGIIVSGIATDPNGNVWIAGYGAGDVPVVEVFSGSSDKVISSYTYPSGTAGPDQIAIGKCLYTYQVTTTTTTVPTTTTIIPPTITIGPAPYITAEVQTDVALQTSPTTTNFDRYGNYAATYSQDVGAKCVTLNGAPLAGGFFTDTLAPGQPSGTYTVTAAPTCQIDGNTPFRFIGFGVGGGPPNGNSGSTTYTVTIPPSQTVTAFYRRERPTVTLYDLYGAGSNLACGYGNYMTKIQYGTDSYQYYLAVSKFAIDGSNPADGSITATTTQSGMSWTTTYTYDSNYYYRCSGPWWGNNLYPQFSSWQVQSAGGGTFQPGPPAWQFIITNDVSGIKGDITATARWGPVYVPYEVDLSQMQCVNGQLAGTTITRRGFAAAGTTITSSTWPQSCGPLSGPGWFGAGYYEPNGDGYGACVNPLTMTLVASFTTVADSGSSAYRYWNGQSQYTCSQYNNNIKTDLPPTS